MNLGWHDAKTQALLHAFPGAQLHALQQAYAEPPRAYHNWQHVLELLRHYSYVEAECGWHKPRAVLLAMLYHDAIYVPGRKDNEAHSAQLALAHLTQSPDEGIDPQRVHGLILATAHHGQHAPASFGDGADADDTRRFLDCDMAILGADAGAFDAYQRGIAEEYRGVVPGFVYHRKRRSFLRALLQLPRIYLSEEFHRRFDVPARANLRRALGMEGGMPAE